jgi:putative membrane protein
MIGICQAQRSGAVAAEGIVEERSTVGRVIQIVMALLIVVVGLAFHIKNDQIVTVNFYVRSLELPLSWVAVAALTCGIALGFIAMLDTVFRQRRELRRLRKKNAMTNRELVNLRALPVENGS